MLSGDPRLLFNRHSSRILGRWRELLRALPPSSALADPELLTPQMVPALARIKHEMSVSPHLERPEVVHVDCRCGLNPMAAFYLTGECATFEVFWGRPDGFAQLTPQEREALSQRLRAAWRRVADDETAVFCSFCQNGKLNAHGLHAHPHAAQSAQPAPPNEAEAQDTP
ncbi:MAG: hypothetical protein H7067_03210 [Burkholderiales bacterium]|nr:hypothetical protein [Opitutaceae bacterium]